MKLKVIFLIPKQKLTKAEKLETELKKKSGDRSGKTDPSFCRRCKKTKPEPKKQQENVRSKFFLKPLIPFEFCRQN